MNFLGVGPGELFLIMLLALIVFGPGKLPEIGRGLGRAIAEFRRATNEITQEFNRELSLDSLLEEPGKRETGSSQTATASPAVPPSSSTATAVAEPPGREEVPAERSASESPAPQEPGGAGATGAEVAVAAETQAPTATSMPEEPAPGERPPNS